MGKHQAKRREHESVAVALLAALSLCACEATISPSAPDSGAPDGGGFNCAPTAPHSAQDVFAKYFSMSQAAGCAAGGCHGTGSGSLTFTSADSLWAATVNQPAMSKPGALRVAPGDPSVSVLYQRLLPSAPARMPPGGPYLDDAALAAVAGWICAGAPDALDGGSPDGGGAPDGGAADAGPPTIAGFSPTSGLEGARVTVTGTGFSSALADDAVVFNGVPAPLHGADAGTLDTEVPVGATTGRITVTVRGQTATSAADFQVIVGNPVPALTGAAPAQVAAGSPTTSVQLTGTGFLAASQARLDGAALPTTYAGATQLTVSLAAASLTTGASHQLTVFNPAPGGGTGAPLAFDVTNPPPALSSIAPQTVATGGATFALTLTGTGFTSGSSVHFNGAAVTTAYASATSLTAQIPTIASAGAYPVTVVNPTPGGGTSGAVQLTAQTITTPLITGPSPSPAPAAAAFALAISGANFDCTGPGARVLFNGSSLTPATCAWTQLAVPVPATAAGTAIVQVRNPNTNLSNVANLTLQAPNPTPALSSLGPGSANAGSAGFTLTANGSSFVSGAVLSFNGAARSTTLVNPTQVTASIPSTDVASAGSFAVVVTNPAPGGGPSNPLPFSVVTVNPAPPSPRSRRRAHRPAPARPPSPSPARASSPALSPRSTLARAPRPSSARRSSAWPSPTSVPGTFPVTVANPAPGGGTSNAVSFAVGSPVPAVTALSPCGAVAGRAR